MNVKLYFIILLFSFTKLYCYTSPNIFTFSDPTNPQTKLGVDLITGDLCFQKNDFTSQGIEPIKLFHYYRKNDKIRNEGVANIFPHILLTLPSYGEAFITEPGGILIKYKKDKNTKFFQPDKNWKMFPDETFSLTDKIDFFHKNKLLVEEEKAYLTLSDGTLRTYAETIDPNSLTRYFYLQEEKKINGHIISYEYNEAKRPLKIIFSSPKTKTIFSTIDFTYHENDFDITVNNKQTIKYLFFTKSHKHGKDAYYFNEIIKPYNKKDEIIYKKDSKSFKPLLSQIEFENGTLVRIQYYEDKTFRVRSIQTQEKNSDKWVDLYSFIYPSEKEKNKKSYVTDDKGNQQVYYFADNHVEQIDFVKEGQLEKRQRFFWIKSKFAKLLQAIATYLPNQNVSSAITYQYDENSNLTKETLYGNLSGECVEKIILDEDNNPLDNGIESYSKKYQHTQDSLHLLVEEIADNGLVTQYAYLPDTNLRSSELLIDRGTIVSRHFSSYDDDYKLIEEIIDDGSSKDKKNLQDVLERKIITYTYFTEGPHAHEIQSRSEKYFDPNLSKEIPLRTIYYSYSDEGKEVEEKIYDADGAFRYRISNTYLPNHKLSTSTDALGNQTIYEYDDNQMLSLYKDGSSAITNIYRYDPLLRQHLIIKDAPNSLTRTSSIDYDVTDHLISYKDPIGNVTHFNYDQKGNCIEIDMPALFDTNDIPYRLKRRYEYDIYGNPVSYTDEADNTSQIKYNSRNQPIEIIHPDGSTTKYLYNLDGTLIERMHPDEKITMHQYDPLHQLVVRQTLAPDREKVLEEEKWSYHGQKLITYTDRYNNIFTYRYDGAGRLIEQQKNHVTTKTYAYDPLGFLHTTKTFYPDDTIDTCITERDNIGRITTKTNTNSQGDTLITKYEYDSYNNPTKITTCKNEETREELFQYDDYNRKIQYIDPLKRVFTYSYEDSCVKNPNEAYTLQITTTNPSSHKIIETYDRLHRLLKKEILTEDEKILSLEQFSYDSQNNLIKSYEEKFSDNDHSKITTTNKDNQITNILKKDESESQIENTFDPSSQSVRCKKSDGIEIIYKYDDKNRLKEVFSSDNTIHYCYQYNENEVEITDHINDAKQKRSIDEETKNILSEASYTGLQIDKEYDSLGRCIKIILPDYSSIEYVYDTDHVKQISRKDPHGKKLYSHENNSSNTYDKVINETMIANLGNITTHYDPIGRITKNITPFAYQTYLWNDENRITQIKSSLFGLFGYEYTDLVLFNQEYGLFFNADKEKQNIEKDKNGNIVKISTNSQEIVFTYDALNRMIIASDNKTFKIHYTYDAYSRRVSKKVETMQDGLWQTLSTIYFLNVDEEEIGYIDENQVIYLKVLAAPKDSTKVIALELGQLYAPLQDANGSILVCIDAGSKAIFESYAYSYFGKQKMFDKDAFRIFESKIQNPWRYHSFYYEPSLDLHFNKGNFYDAKLGKNINENILQPLDLKTTFSLEKEELFDLSDLTITYPDLEKD